MGTLLFVRMLQGVPQEVKDMAEEPWIKGVEYLLSKQSVGDY
ncbi:hypothetical protein [Clostridium sp. 1xD42-85]|nr:hypothetical protein [Clostridium sp. 1xD42-85]